MKKIKSLIKLNNVPFILLLGAFFYSIFFVSHIKGVPYFNLPITKMQNSNLVYVDSKIQDKNYLLIIDTGSTSSFQLQQESIDKIVEKRDNGFATWVDIHGNNYQSPKFSIKKISLGKLDFLDFTVEIKPHEFIKKWSYFKTPEPNNANIYQEIQNQIGTIGIGAIRKHNYWLFDFPRSSLIIITDLDQYEKTFAYPFTGYLKTKIDDWRGLVVLNIDTDFGLKKFILDTASDYTVINQVNETIPPHKWIETKKFKISRKNVGPQKLYTFKFPSSFEFDGIIGMDFLKDRPILLDFKNNEIYIGPKINRFIQKIF